MMMYPFYGYKRPYRNYTNRYNTLAKNNSYNNNPINNNCLENAQINNCSKSSLENTCEQDEKKNPRYVKQDHVDFFEILGFKLYYDDLLIIGLIILLFQEGVKDQLLLISLILLIGD